MWFISLTKDKFAYVDDEDFAYLGQWKWQANLSHDHWYVGRTDYSNGKKTRIKMHRVIMNAPENMDVDHIDGNGFNNTRSNLRICTRPQNLWNRGKDKDNTSGYKGIYLIKKAKKRPWCANMIINGKSIRLGNYATAEEAALAYDEAARKYHGEFARFNFPVGLENPSL